MEIWIDKEVIQIRGVKLKGLGYCKRRRDNMLEGVILGEGG